MFAPATTPLVRFLDLFAFVAFVRALAECRRERRAYCAV